jgi:beta-lactamase superfamily II metal-dependent hydrolase
MKFSPLVLCFLGVTLPATLLHAADTLDMYVLDVDGGKAEIITTPAGQNVLIDAGSPGRGGGPSRDLTRVLDAAKTLGIKQFDYAILSHYDVDHAGNIPALAEAIPIQTFVDHGAIGPDPKMLVVNRRAGEAYLTFVADKKRITVKPGDTLPLKGLTVTILTSDEKVIEKPLPGAGAANPACPTPAREVFEKDDNAPSIGELWQFGRFRMADFGDLLAWVENRLVCPTNKVGPVDVFMVNHHGVELSNSPELVAALHPKASIMNNGDRKGNAPETMKTLRDSGGDIWQNHFTPRLGPEGNAPENFIANMSATDDKAFWIKVSARADGTFTITNPRTGFSKDYK